MAALGGTRDVPTLPAHSNEQRDLVQRHSDVPVNIGVMYQHQPHHRYTHHVPYHHHHIQQQHQQHQAGGHSMVITPSSPRGFVAPPAGVGGVVISGGTSNNRQGGEEIDVHSPDYDNLAPPVAISRFVEEGGAGSEKVSINRNHDNSVTNHQQPVSMVGGDVTGRGPLSGGSGVSDSDRYKSGDEKATARCSSSYSSAGNGIGSGEVGRPVRVAVTCEAAVRKNDIMGNQFSNARVGSVSEERAQQSVGVGDKRVGDKVTPYYGGKGEDIDNDGRATSGSTDKRPDDATFVKTARFPVEEGVDVDKKIEKSGEFRDGGDSATRHAVHVSSSDPVVTGTGTGSQSRMSQNMSQKVVGDTGNGAQVTVKGVHSTQVVSSVEIRGQNVVPTIQYATESVGNGTTQNSKEQTPPFPVELQTHFPVKSPSSSSSPSASSSSHFEHQTSSHANRNFSSSQPPKTVENSTMSAPAIIVTPSSPVMTSPTSTSPRNVMGQESKKGITLHKEAPKISNGEVNTTSEGMKTEQDMTLNNKTEAEADPPELRAKTKKWEGQSRSSAPVGGVKVLPSTFMFNPRSFRETKKTESVSSKTTENTKMSSPPPVAPKPSSSIVMERQTTDSYSSAKVASVTPVTTQAPQWGPVTTHQGAVTTNVMSPTVATASTTVVISESTRTTKTTTQTVTTPVSASGSTMISSQTSTNSETSQDKPWPRPSAQVVVTRPEQTRSDNSNGNSVPSGFSRGIPFSQIRQPEAKQKEDEWRSVTENIKSPTVSTHTVSSTSACSTSYSQVPRPAEVIIQPYYDSNYDTIPEEEGSGYKVISRPGEPRSDDAIVVKSSANTNIVQHTVVKSPDNIEADYAVPIPKSQRLSSGSGSSKEPPQPHHQQQQQQQIQHQQIQQREMQQQQTSEQPAPPRPPRVPRASTEPPAPSPPTYEDDDTFGDVVLRNKVQVSCQMKKSTTTGMLSSASSDYCNIPRSYSTSYDYFSLGRRPRQHRVKTLTDSRGMAVSLDVLLRNRRQSSAESSITNIPEQTLSVDDILKSCDEFQNCDSYYRNRTSSDAVKKSPYHPHTTLTFAEVTNVKFETPDIKEKGKREGPQAASSRPILKRNKNEIKPYGEMNDSNVTTRAKQDMKTNDTLVSPPGVKNFNGRSSEESRAMNTSVTGDKPENVSHSVTCGHQVVRENKERVTFKDTKSDTVGPKEYSQIDPVSKSEGKGKPDVIKSYIGLDREERTGYHVTKGGVAGVSPRNTDKPASDKALKKIDKHPVSDTKQQQTGKSHTKSSTSSVTSVEKVNVQHSQDDKGNTMSTEVVHDTYKIVGLNPKPATPSASAEVSGYAMKESTPSVTSPMSPEGHAFPVWASPASPQTPQQGQAVSKPMVIPSHSVPKGSSSSSSSSSASSPLSPQQEITASETVTVKIHTSSTSSASPTSPHAPASSSVEENKPATQPKPKVPTPPANVATSKSSNVSDRKTESTSSFKHQTTSSTSSSSDMRESLTSTSEVQSPLSSDAMSPLSPVSSVWSDTTDGASHKEVSLLTVDISNSTSRGESPSPGRRSPNYHAKLEAVEALKWLRAAGFPQYAQMFEDGQFPVDLSVVERDHDFLDKDSLKSLFRRLETLNKYAGMKIDSHSRKKAAGEEEDDDDLCALSERWEYQKSVRRWSRKDLNSPPAVSSSEDQDPLGIRSGSHDSLLADQDSGSQTGDSPLLDSKMPHQGSNAPGGVVVQRQPSGDNNDKNASQQGQGQQPISPRLRRVASERIKTAKNLFKKMEGLKSKKSRRHPNQRNIVEISGPVVADRENMQAKLQRLNCVDISPTSETLPGPPMAGVRASDRGPSVDRVDGQRTSPEAPLSPTSPQPSSYPTSPRLASESRSSDASSDSASQPAPESALRSRFAGTSQSLRARPTGSSVGETRNTQSIHDSTLNEYYSAQSSLLQNLQSAQPGGAGVVKKNNSDTNLMEIFLLPQDHQPGSFPRLLQNGYIETEACGTAVNSRTGSVRLGRDTGMPADHHRFNRRANELSQPSRVGGNRVSVYDNFLPSDGRKPVEGGGVRSVIPGIIELGPPKGIQKSDSGDSSTIGSDARGSLSVDMKSDRNTPVSHESDQTDTARTSRESSAQRTDDQESVSIRDRSVSFESSSSRTGHEGTPVSEREFPSCGDSRTSQNSSSDSSSLHSRKVTHSASVDSYFRDSSGGGTTISSSSDNNTSSSTLQQEYDEFDVILRQLYENIDDLTRFMSRDKEAEQPKMVHVSSAPNPSIATSTNTNSNKTQAPLHVVAPSTLPVSPKSQQQPAFELYSPTSPTSDLVLSPASPLSPDGADESMDLDGVTELDNNSWSGGEGSNTAESGSEDQDVPLTDLSHDDSLDQIPEVSRERRDSGVGHSLTRAPSERRRKKIRWHSFQRCHRPDVNSRAMQINSLTVGQLVRLQKLSLLKLTGIMEKCLPVNKSGWNWMMPRFMKRHKAPDFSERNVFGVPLSVMAQRTGQPLPQCVLYAMRYLRRTSQNAVGIFRKSGVKSKIQQLRDHLEAHPDTTDFEGINAYNVADMLKTYFRDLPECLLTTKMSETFRSIYTHVPQSQRLEAIQAAILLLPDENREVLQSILLFLSDISTHEADHQMNASNLAVCFTPTVFQLGSRQTASNSPKRSRKNSPGIPDPREIMEQKAAHECLLMMITECKKLFTVPANQFRQLQVQSLAHLEPAPLQDIGNSPSEVRAFGQERIQMVLKEAHDKNRGWVQAMTVNDVEIFHRKPMDNCPLKEWKMVVDIEAPPIEVLRRIMHERHAWDEDLLSWSVVERLDPYSDIFQFVLNSMAPHPSRHYCVLRYWRSDLNKGACALITMSVEHTDAMEVQGVWAADLGSYFLMEPCGSGRARVTYITRVDTRGRTPEWYTKIFGHLCANFLERLKESFKQDASGPETKV